MNIDWTVIGSVAAVGALIYTFLRNFKTDMLTRFDVIDKRFEAIDKRFEKLENKIDKISEAVSSIKSRMDKLEVRVE